MVVTALVAAACGAKGDESSSTTVKRTTTTEVRQTTTSTTAQEPPTAPQASGQVLRVLVTNDDGVQAPGIAVLVDALRALPNTQVTVVAPSQNRSGTGGKVSEGSVSTSGTTTLGGYPATAVEGFPADAVAVALGENGPQPDVVVSGVNDGANLGPVTAISGTVGAARAAAEAGIPSLAVSQGKGSPADFANGARLAVLWVEQHREQLLARDMDVIGVVSLNVPTCTNGTVHGVKEVPPAESVAGSDAAPDCSAATQTVDPADDVQAYLNGWASQSELPLDG
jgi:5'-nucleotidase